jgi:uncharacterized repeat protein (TIGR03847 family)
VTRPGAARRDPLPIMGTLYELDPATHLTTGFIGQPGKRVFYLQAFQAREVVTLIVEKQQVEALAYYIEQLIAEIKEKYPQLPDPSPDYDPQKMALQTPLDPAFRVGQLGLGYDSERDLMVLVAQEINAEERNPEEASSARFFATRSQFRALSQHCLTIAKQGRPICGMCGQPIDPEGHFCPRRNGHQH